MSEEAPTAEAAEPQAQPEQPTPTAAGWELWSKLSMVLAIVMVGLWIFVFTKPGILGVQALLTLPYLGGATLVLLAWGLIRTLFNPPALRRSRTIAFFTLLGCGYIGTVPVVPAPLATESYESRNAYRLPVEGEWMVLAGGRDKAANYHATFPPTRWGYDFSIVKDGKRYQLDGNATTDFFCFDQPVFAPVDGRVVALENHHVDNNPGEVSPTSMLGNFVIIEATGGEFTLLAHLKKGSITTKIGADIASGEQIARCGNSGQSPEPHVHMHVQDRKSFPIAQGLPIGFADIVVNGAPQKAVMPTGASSWVATDGSVVEQR